MKDVLFFFAGLYLLTQCTMTKKLLATGMLLAATFATTSMTHAAFSDVPADHWAASAIQWASDAGIMKGPDNMPGMFDPAGVANRAQLATVMQRLVTMIDAKLADLNTKLDSLDKATDANVTDLLLKADMLNKTYVAHLNGKQETPAVTTNGMGTGYFMLASDGLHYQVEVSNLAGGITGGHINDGKIGMSGPVRYNLKFTNNMASGVWRYEDMTKDDVAALLNGDMYVNLQTNSFTDGEIRGQLLPAMAYAFHGELTPAQEVSDVDSNAMGMFHGVLVGDSLVFEVTYKDLSTAFSGAHIHSGAIGESGGIVKEITCDTAAMMCTGIWGGLSQSDKDALWNGGLYTNIHTQKYPNGELRAQILMR